MRSLSIHFVLLCLIACAHLAQAGDTLSLKGLIDIACHEGNLQKALQYAKDLKEQLESHFATTDSAELAGMCHARSELELIVNGDYEQALLFHKLGKSTDSTVVPHLAKLHMDGHTCGGISDVFFVSAVIIKQTIDKGLEKGVTKFDPALFDAEMMHHAQEAFQTLITLTSDAGLHNEAAALVRRAAALLEDLPTPLNPDDKVSLAALQFRAALLTPAVYESGRHLRATRAALLGDMETLEIASRAPSFDLEKLDEFALSPTFYFVYQGYHDKQLLELLHRSYGRSNPSISRNHLSAEQIHRSSDDSDSSSGRNRNIRVGFVSAHYRRHSICKLFCGIITRLAAEGSGVDVVLFSGLQENKEDETTFALINSLPHGNKQFIRIGKTLVYNREEVLKREIDVLVYLDVGMDPATMIWAGARLARVQVCLWGHPTTTGMPHMDYFVSSFDYHVDNEQQYLLASTTGVATSKAGVLPGSMQDISPISTWAYERFTEQLIQFDSLGFFFKRPTLAFAEYDEPAMLRAMSLRDDAYYNALLGGAGVRPYAPTGLLREIVLDRKQGKIKAVLCPQHLPKMHHGLDPIFKGILSGCKQCRLILVADGAKKGQWKRTLMSRWAKSIGSFYLKQIIWLENIKPEAYLTLLALGDLMIDPFPFGGGVTTLESLSVCTPVITIPTEQTVPGLAAGQLRQLTSQDEDASFRQQVEKMLIPRTVVEYVSNSLVLLNKNEMKTSSELESIRDGICARSHILYENAAAVTDWRNFLQRV